jgi:serine/threonine protein kinase
MGFSLNQVIGNYECLGIIDKPRAGVTYKVRNLATGEIESLRALPGTTSRDHESTERLLREIRIQTRLSHPNIVEFHDAFEIDGHLVMTTEFVEAPTLAELCKAGPLPVRDAVQTIAQVLDGLDDAHALGIVHRGITAEHVTVTPGGAVKLSGFDLAKPTFDTRLTRVGTVSGDPRYISPEQITAQSIPDARSDLYSVGVLLYQTLTGKLPFEAATDIDVLAAQVSSDPSRPSQLNAEVSPDVDRIVLTALEKDPKERFPNAKVFRAALEAAAIATRPEQLPANGAHSTVPHSIGHTEPRSFITVPMICGFVIVVAGIAVISWVAMH